MINYSTNTSICGGNKIYDKVICKVCDHQIIAWKLMMKLCFLLVIFAVAPACLSLREGDLGVCNSNLK